MKTLFTLIICFCLSTVLFSQIKKEDVAKEWIHTKIQIYEGNDLLDEFDYSSYDCKDVVHFTENGTTNSVTYEEGKCDTKLETNGTYILEGSKLHVTENEETYTFEINTLTATEMVLSLRNEEDDKSKVLIYFQAK